MRGILTEHRDALSRRGEVKVMEMTGKVLWGES